MIIIYSPKIFFVCKNKKFNQMNSNSNSVLILVFKDFMKMIQTIFLCKVRYKTFLYVRKKNTWAFWALYPLEICLAATNTSYQWLKQISVLGFFEQNKKSEGRFSWLLFSSTAVQPQIHTTAATTAKVTPHNWRNSSGEREQCQLGLIFLPGKQSIL